MLPINYLPDIFIDTSTTLSYIKKLCHHNHQNPTLHHNLHLAPSTSTTIFLLSLPLLPPLPKPTLQTVATATANIVLASSSQVSSLTYCSHCHGHLHQWHNLLLLALTQPPFVINTVLSATELSLLSLWHYYLYPGYFNLKYRKR